ncbi:MAG: sensor histidine kinase [Ruminococcus sp.]|nr:sensor histidine kinase [Ruminococcus sp.]
MRGLIDKVILFFISLFLLPVSCEGFYMAAFSLAVFIGCALISAFPKTYVRLAVSAAYFAVCCFYHEAALLCAPLIYCVFESEDKREMLCAFPMITIAYLVGAREGILCTVYAALAAVLCYRRVTFEQKDSELKVTRDYGVENSLVLIERNKRLIEQQNNEINMATLKERNRIAREIHDNVGHVLSRSLLQLGAVMAVTKNDEKMTALLQPVRESMDLALDSIRKSVHDLRDDSISLKAAAEDILKPLEDNYTVKKQYDFSDSIDKDAKLCIIAVLKEAVTNTIRHSDADTISVSITEHPAFVQLIIDDNGTKQAPSDGEGMGLSNMRERVKMLDGIINITSEKGFRIFITIPKKT